MSREIQPKLNSEDKELMEKLLTAGDIKHKYAVRLQTVLHRANKKHTKDVAEYSGINAATVSSYVRRYHDDGINALIRDKTRKPEKAPISEEVKKRVCKVACTERPKDATHWSTRTLGKKFGISHNAVNQILRERSIKPHLVKRFQLSHDPDFESKLNDVVGL